MKFQIQFRVGKTQLTLTDEAADTKDFFRKAAFVHSLPENCGVCGSDDIVFDHRTAQGFEFFEVKCNNPDCKHVLRFGQYKESGELFAKQWVVRNGREEVPV